MKALCSDEVLSTPSPAITQLLRDKHPSAPQDRRAHPSLSADPLRVSPTDVIKAIKSFTPGSSAGSDGLRPQHLVDMTENRVTGTLVDAIADLVNQLEPGGITDSVRAVFFGAYWYSPRSGVELDLEQ